MLRGAFETERQILRWFCAGAQVVCGLSSSLQFLHQKWCLHLLDLGFLASRPSHLRLGDPGLGVVLCTWGVEQQSWSPPTTCQEHPPHPNCDNQKYPGCGHMSPGGSHPWLRTTAMDG